MRQLHKSSLTPTSPHMNWKSPIRQCLIIATIRREQQYFFLFCSQQQGKHRSYILFFTPTRNFFLFLIVDMKRSKIAWKLKLNQIVETILNSLHPNINIHILLTVLFTFPMVMTRRICLRIRSFLNWWSFPFFSLPLYLIQACSCREKLETSHSLGLKCSWEAS